MPKEKLLLYVVYKQGMYGHGVHGIDTSLESAIVMADKAAERDVDNYHSYDVYEVPAGSPPAEFKNKRADYGWMNNDPVYSTEKQ